MKLSVLPIILTAAGMAGGMLVHRLKPVSLAHHQLNFRWRNQRQLRKNRRRAHAAGKLNAFA